MSWGIWGFKTCRGSWRMKEDAGKEGSAGKEKPACTTAVIVATHCIERQLWFGNIGNWPETTVCTLTSYCEWQHHRNTTQLLLQTIFFIFYKCHLMKFHTMFSSSTLPCIRPLSWHPPRRLCCLLLRHSFIRQQYFQLGHTSFILGYFSFLHILFSREWRAAGS